MICSIRRFKNNKINIFKRGFKIETSEFIKNIKKGTKEYFINIYNKNKIFFWIILIIILLGILPIFPSSEKKIEKLSIPHPESNYKIPIYEGCYFFNSMNQNDISIILNIDTPYYNNYMGEKREEKIIKSPLFKGWYINIIGMNSCNDCVKDETLNIQQSKTCIMNNTEIWGYLEKCKYPDNAFTKDNFCKRYPFIISDNLEIVTPDKSFKFEIKPYQTATKIKPQNYAYVQRDYYFEIVYTYPKFKGLPYAKWIGTALLFLLDPLKWILKYFMDRWFF